jgi:hypothetical protein
MNRDILGGLIAAGCMIALSLMLRLSHIHDGKLQTRAVNVIVGLLMVWMATGRPSDLSRWRPPPAHPKAGSACAEPAARCWSRAA